MTQLLVVRRLLLSDPATLYRCQSPLAAAAAAATDNHPPGGGGGGGKRMSLCTHCGIDRFWF
jgi:hypothetical protein